MNTHCVIFFAALYAQSVLGSFYHGSPAHTVVLHNGYLADTHEVAAAKNAHLAALSQRSHGRSYGHQGAYSQDGHHGDLRYHGPTAVPHVLHDGHIADTHEVAAAKAEHYAAVAKARAHGGYNNGGDYSGQYASGHNHGGDYSGQYASGHNHGGDYSRQYASGYDHYSEATGAYNGHNTHASYHGPIAIPHVLHDGHIADTHEVAAAKAEHYAAVAKARAYGGYNHGGDYSSQYASGYNHYSGISGVYHGHVTHGSYHGPLAKPVVLSSGYLADTHEVAAVKQKHLQAVHSSKPGYYNAW